MDEEPMVLFDRLDADGNVLADLYGEAPLSSPVVIVEALPRGGLASFEASRRGKAGARAADEAGCVGARVTTFGTWQRRGGVACFLADWNEDPSVVVSWRRIS